MSIGAFSLPIGKLAGNNAHGPRKIVPSNCLRYCPPSPGGWDITRVGLLVPESVMLLASPACCGRHGAISGIQRGFKNRLFLLQITEVDAVSGDHLTKVRQAGAEILKTAFPQPKALTICVTCIDDLLGSDYAAIARRLEAEYAV